MRAIKEGELTKQYDAPFVFAEVSLQNMTSTADPNLYFSSLYPLFPLHMYNISYAPHNFSTKMSEHSGGLRPTEDI